MVWGDMLALWRNAESWGYDSLWNFDHFYPIFTDPSGPCFEGWTTLSALAQATSRVRIGHLVNGNTYRNPCILAKMAATLDHVSDGRLNLGLGAGWFEAEHTSFGIDFKTVRGRLDALDEACRIVKGMLDGEKVTLEGEHYNVRDAICVPRPVQSHVPLMMGGEGKKIMLKLVARYADMWNAAGSPAKIGDLIQTIERHAEAQDRDPDKIEKTVMMSLCYTENTERQEMMAAILGASFGMEPAEAREQMMIGTADQCLEKIGRYVRAGCTHFIFMTFAPYFVDEIQGFAETVIPAAREAHG